MKKSPTINNAPEGGLPATPCSRISAPETEAFKQEWPDNRRYNWPCTFESAAFAKIEKLERERNARVDVTRLRKFIESMKLTTGTTAAEIRNRALDDVISLFTENRFYSWHVVDGYPRGLTSGAWPKIP
jgi:hypothetical protein